MDSATITDVTIVIPIYNGSSYIEDMIKALDVMGLLHPERAEVIMVDDGSSDASWDLLQKYAQQGSITAIRMRKNYGQHGATVAGILQATRGRIVTMDQDLQHRPEDIPVLLEYLDRGFDLVYGTPRELPNTPVRNLLTTLAKKSLSFVTNQHSLTNISAFRAFDAKLKEDLARYTGPQIIMDVILLWSAGRTTVARVNIAASRSSNYSYWSLVQVALRVLVSFSTAPLKIGSWLGFGMTVVGVVVLLYVLGVYITVGSIPGFPFIASLVTIFGGAQLFIFGIFGEYLAKIYEGTLGKPRYAIAEIQNSNQQTQSTSSTGARHGEQGMAK